VTNVPVDEQGFGLGEKLDYQQAQWLAINLEGKWRFDHTAKRWHHWDGHRWAPDETGKIKHDVALLAARACIPGAPHVGVPKDVLKKLLDMGPLNRALEALATFDGYGTNGDDWDSDPFTLGVSNGLVDLRTNTLVERPSPSCLVSLTTGVKFNPLSDLAGARERAPRFMTFMDEITSSDPQMIVFLLMWYGASMFGFSPEQRFLLMTGIGRNGKGALKAAVMKAVGEYGAQFDANLYMRSKFGATRADAARADLMALKGKRITFFSEPEGNRFNEELLKAHTGGDQIVARALYSNNIQTWDPTHSITFLVNDAPEVEDLGPSMAARVMVADFRERFDGDKEDRGLYGVLASEKEGILAILCFMAQKWYAEFDAGRGLAIPERVREQSQKFMERNDPIADFINEACRVAPEERGRGQALYDAYKDWHVSSGRDDDTVSNVKFSALLEKKGFRKGRSEMGIKWIGIAPLGAMALAERQA
jgi:putative DNA primase/helicase